MTPEEIAKVELLVNKEILKGVEVSSREMPIEEARKLGAMALFGEKYGDIVRVVSIEDFSCEFCGGTHIPNTSRIGLFKIVSESSVASGVRRIEGVTGFGVLGMLAEETTLIHNTAAVMKLNNPSEISVRAAQLLTELKEKDSAIESLNSRIAGMQMDGLFAEAKEINGVKVITALFSGTESAALRTMCDRIRDQASDIVAVLACTSNGKGNIAATVGKGALAKGLHAGKLVKAVAQVTGGNGGGKPDFAMAGAKDLTKLDEALAAAEGFVADMMAN